ncbi:GGDEF domain-containing protein [Desulfuribacillus alkaliarsenatis]|uniref:GGDEF domain-containing protein n=1 Tax=Desulfuribacillus alkaliarsenatis TaxID=766136 RepID=A0A1E5G311_9FIRM|nr:GGDEF domain-containing protein [Desulfuribacillus alkaliarsenatis]OEF97465.1 hypothetical protein BHF68_04465 [Desulfuribacillus alkaliarsenatis]
MGIERYVDKLKGYFKVDSVIWAEVCIINLQRIQYLAWVMAIVHVAHVLLFWFHIPPSDSATAITWRYGIITVHAIMFVIALVFSIIAFLLKKSKQRLTSKTSIAFQGLVILAYLLFGIVVSTIDQLVTPEITPFLMATIGIAVVLLIHPLLAATNYLAAYVILYHAVAITQLEQELLLSIRVNGITVIGIGFGVAVMLWRIHITKIQQQQLIRKQKLELKDKNRQLEQLANCDSLTGLYNRTYIMEHVDTKIKGFCAEGLEINLVIMDIDHFKKVNDNYGHPAGDKVLKEVANILKTRLRKFDIIARIGGEEFLIILPRTTINETKKIAEKLRSEIESSRFIYDNHQIVVTASFGIASMLCSEQDPVSKSYYKADRALYKAKELGRNKVETAT